MFGSKQLFVAAAVALCAATSAPALARVPDHDRDVAKVLSVWQVHGTKRCQHSLYVDRATGAPTGPITTGGARCAEA